MQKGNLESRNGILIDGSVDLVLKRKKMKNVGFKVKRNIDLHIYF